MSVFKRIMDYCAMWFLTQWIIIHVMFPIGQYISLGAMQAIIKESNGMVVPNLLLDAGVGTACVPADLAEIRCLMGAEVEGAPGRFHSCREQRLRIVSFVLWQGNGGSDSGRMDMSTF